MPDFHFYQPIEVRYGDLDPQGHVNNAKYLTYLEQARIAYISHLGLWPGGSFQNLGIILAEIQVSFRKPVLYGLPLRAGVRVTHLGNKSLTMEHSIEHAGDNSVFATGSSVLVSYDYITGQTITIPDTWRQTIQQFEKLQVD